MLDIQKLSTSIQYRHDLISAPASQAYAECLFNVCGDMTAGKWNRMAKKL